MDFNTILLRFGLDSDCFINKELSAIQTSEGMVYEVEEAYKERVCPFCNHFKLNIHDYSWIHIRLNSTINLSEILYIKRIRYKCVQCGKTKTFELQGIRQNNSISNFTINAIKQEFFKIQSFSTIAERYGISTTQVINIFDEYTKIMLRRPLPEYLCIDEKHFEGDTDGKYVAILSDFFSGDIIDVIPNRQLAYLERYFQNIPLRERENVKVFISDMYDSYSTIKYRYFPKAIYVVDLFHVVKLLTTAVNKLRILTYKQYTLEDSIERYFMKNNWKLFLTDFNKIYKNDYYSKKYNCYIEYGQIILKCLSLNNAFWNGYNVLQELIQYDKYETYTEAEKFMNRIINRLEATNDEGLLQVAASYKKWKAGIIKWTGTKPDRKKVFKLNC